MNALVLNNRKIIAKSITAFTAVICAVALPQLFHLAGIVSGTGAAVGAAFLPMHIPVLLAGLLAGQWAGLTAGLLSPVLSFAISGMPAAALLPFMTVELAAYGLLAGLLSYSRLPVTVQLIISMAAGRLAKALSIFIAVSFFSSQASVLSVWESTVAGLPGIILQLVVIPLLVYRLQNNEKVKKLYE